MTLRSLSCFHSSFRHFPYRLNNMCNDEEEKNTPVHFDILPFSRIFMPLLLYDVFLHIYLQIFTKLVNYPDCVNS